MKKTVRKVAFESVMKYELFGSPPPLCRPAPFWSWNDSLDREELLRQVDEMAKSGWGGYFCHSRVGLITEYLSEKWMSLIQAVAQEARKTQTYAWLYDEDKWPSGFAGGKVPLMNEKYRSRALVLLKKEEVTENDTVLMESKQNGSTYLIAKRVSSLGSKWFNLASYVDLMNPDAVQAFLTCTHEQYKKACGEYFGKEIPGIFTDEPCYLMHGHYDVPVLPWSEHLPDFFEKSKGYSLIEHLECLWFDLEGYQKIRFDFFDCAVRLFMESFTIPYSRWCERNGLKMTGHFMAEDDLSYQIQWIGAAMPHYQFMHWPGIDKLGRHLEQLVTVKQLTSVSDQLQKERAFSEVFGCVGQQVSFFDRKWIADWQAALGINFVNYHLSLYSMRGERKRDYPANLFYQQSWFDCEKNFADYIGRLCVAAGGGKRQLDILVLHPITSAWCEYNETAQKSGHSRIDDRFNKPFELLSRQLMENHLDFHYGDEIIMEKHAFVKDSKLHVGQHAYSIVIVPPSVGIRSNTLRLLQEFSAQAGANHLLFVEMAPDLVDGCPTTTDFSSFGTLTPDIGSVLTVLETLCTDRVTVMETLEEKNCRDILCHCRKEDGFTSILFSNTSHDRKMNVNIFIPFSGNIYIMDLMSGKTFPAPMKNRQLNVTFYPAGSLLLSVSENPLSCHPLPAVLDSGVSFQALSFPSEGVGNISAQALESNVLPVNHVTLSMDGKYVAENVPTVLAAHRYFYPSADGIGFRAEYRFVSACKLNNCFAAVEMAENCSRITFNGKNVRPLKTKGQPYAFSPKISWKDVNFTKVPLDTILPGENLLTLEGIKINNITAPGNHRAVENSENYLSTEVESIYIVGNFGVYTCDHEKFWLDSPPDTINTENATETGYPFYCDKFKYSFDVIMSTEKQGLLSFSLNGGACAQIFVNHKEIGIKYWAPYQIDLSPFLQTGVNRIDLVLSATLFNLMGPNQINGILQDTSVSPRTFLQFDRYSDFYTLLPLGIAGVAFQ